MALTRRGAAFRELAEAADAGLQARGVDLSSKDVDAVLSAHIETVAALMRVQPRQALWYAPEGMAEAVAQAIADQLTGPRAESCEDKTTS